MSLYYAQSTSGFYDDGIHADIPPDAVPITEVERASLLAGQSAGKLIAADTHGRPVLQDPAPPTPGQIAQSIAIQVQAHMDAQAKQAGYDDIRSAVTYADEPAVLKFQAEGQCFRAWRSLVWDRCYQLLDEVQNGTRTPMTADQVIAELPMLQLP